MAGITHSKESAIHPPSHSRAHNWVVSLMTGRGDRVCHPSLPPWEHSQFCPLKLLATNDTEMMTARTLFFCCATRECLPSDASCLQAKKKDLWVLGFLLTSQNTCYLKLLLDVNGFVNVHNKWPVIQGLLCPPCARGSRDGAGSVTTLARIKRSWRMNED